MKKPILDYNELISKLYPEYPEGAYEVTFQVCDYCNLACTYCYQINKKHNSMKFEDAKKLIDKILDRDKSIVHYVDINNYAAIILDFIGGEPFLEVELMDKIVDYFKSQALVKCPRLLKNFRISISSNGLLYFNPKVQAFIEKHLDNLSMNITLDGSKELHDKCRFTVDGQPTYDKVVSAIKDWFNRGRFMGSKVTLAPANIMCLNEAVRHMIDLGYDEIHGNCVFEKGWGLKDAKIYYNELKNLADYYLQDKLYDKVYISFFDEEKFKPMDESNNENYCGGTGKCLALSPNGKLYPCLRYMESSLGDSVEPYVIGDVDNGIAFTCEQCNKVECLKKITRRSQCTDECYYCPIGQGCSWCSGYNYQEFGTANKRATYICEMHKAEALANVYFWNRYYKLENINKHFPMYCPKEWAIPIIGEEEYNLLFDLSKEE